jgi:hypothetical protein
MGGKLVRFAASFERAGGHGGSGPRQDHETCRDAAFSAT